MGSDIFDAQQKNGDKSDRKDFCIYCLDFSSQCEYILKEMVVNERKARGVLPI